MDFQSINTVKEERLKNLKGIVSKVSDLKSGTTDKGDWTMKIFTFEDPTGIIDMACFNGDIKKFEKGFTYEIENFWWKEKDGKYSAALGGYAKIIKTPTEQQTPLETHVEKTEPTGTPLPEISEALRNFVVEEDILLLQIEEVIATNHLKWTGKGANGQRVGLHVKLIYEQARKTNLIKASNIK